MQKYNVHFSKQKLFAGASWGIVSAFLYSLAPLFIIFMGTSTLDILVLVTIQELFSWILVVFIGKNPIKTLKLIFKNGKTSLGMIVIIAGVFGGPIAQVLYVLSIYLAARMSTTATVLVNIAPIFTAILSRMLLEEKLSFFAWLGLLLTSLAVLGLVAYQIVGEFLKTATSIDPNASQPWMNASWAIILSLITALLYAVESTILHFAMSKAKKPISDKDAVALKAFSSSFLMLILILPIISIINGGYGYEGWKQFKILADFKGLAAFFITISSLAIAVGRIMYFKSVKVLNASYGMTFQLMMLIWTPILSLIFYAIYKAMNYDFGILNIPKLPQDMEELYDGATQWVYYLFLVPILAGLIMLIFNENFFKKKKTKEVWHQPVEVK